MQPPRLRYQEELIALIFFFSFDSFRLHIIINIEWARRPIPIRLKLHVNVWNKLPSWNCLLHFRRISTISIDFSLFVAYANICHWPCQCVCSRIIIIFCVILFDKKCIQICFEWCAKLFGFFFQFVHGNVVSNALNLVLLFFHSDIILCTQMLLNSSKVEPSANN